MGLIASLWNKRQNNENYVSESDYSYISDFHCSLFLELRSEIYQAQGVVTKKLKFKAKKRSGRRKVIFRCTELTDAHRTNTRSKFL